MTQYLKRFCWLTCMALTALIAVYGFIPTAQAQQAAGSGVSGQSQSQSCTARIETVEDKLREAENLIAAIEACNEQEKVYTGGGCVYPSELNHSWSGTVLRIDGTSLGDLKGATGDKGPDAECPAGTCECPNGNCEQASCYVDPDDGGGTGGILPCANPQPRCGSATTHRKCPIRICERAPHPDYDDKALCVYAASNQHCP